MRPSSIGVTPRNGFSVSAVPPPTNPSRRVPPLRGAPVAVDAGELELEPPPHAAASSGDMPMPRAAAPLQEARAREALVEQLRPAGRGGIVAVGHRLLQRGWGTVTALPWVRGHGRGGLRASMADPLRGLKSATATLQPASHRSPHEWRTGQEHPPKPAWYAIIPDFSLLSGEVVRLPLRGRAARPPNLAERTRRGRNAARLEPRVPRGPGRHARRLDRPLRRQHRASCCAGRTAR